MKKLVLAGMLLAIVFTVGTTAGFTLAGDEDSSRPGPSEPASLSDCWRLMTGLIARISKNG